ncbi:MAG: tetratricopeptide repeat protein [Bacteroidetes bacterium]|nr:tetratricopeptide repeat protein [Bacteroidota bacterium]
MKSTPLWILCMLVFLSGCSSNSFLGSRFDNFSAYYNKYYNAERALAEGIRNFEESLEGSPVDQDVFLSLFTRSQQASTQRKPFEDAITKSIEILRNHPNSKWVDDAIMVIGKAWFFTLNFVGAEEKFNDILELDSPLRDEANFWLARTLIASGDYEEAFTHLQAILNAEEISRRWEPRYRLALAELHIQNENWEEAAIELGIGLAADLRDNDLAAKAQFLEGQVLEQLGRYEDAIAAYERVQRYKPFYELSYAAQFSAVRVAADHVDADVAMRNLRRMERDDKNFDHRAELAYLRGRVLIAQGLYDEALAQYDELLYDPTLGGARMRGPVHYVLGTFYRDVELNYPYAAAHFDTASQAITSPSTIGQSRQGASAPPKPSPGAIIDIKEQAETFGSFSDVLDEIILMDSLLYLGTLDDSSFAEVVLELRQRRADEIAKMQRKLRQRESESAFVGSGGAADYNNGGGGTLVAGSEGEAGFLYHKDQVRMEQARQDFILIWGGRPLAPNWRRIAAIEAAQAEVMDEEGGRQGQPTFNVSLPTVNISAVPRSQEAFDKMLSDRANVRYELANVLFLSMNLPDSAAAWYRMVIEEDFEESVAQRAYYALAEVQQTLGDTLAANRLYEVIVSDYPDSDFTTQAYTRLGRPLVEHVSTDSVVLAEEDYKKYQTELEEDLPEAVVTNMLDLALKWPTTPTAPQALHFAGTAYLKWAARDSLDVLAALPVQVDATRLEAAGFYSDLDSTATAEDSLLTLPLVLGHLQNNFPNSLQADRARRLLIALEEERQLRKAIADSLATQRALAIADSIAQLNAAPDSLDQMLLADSLGIAADSLAQLVQMDSLAVASELLEKSLPEESRAIADKVIADSLDQGVPLEKEEEETEPKNTIEPQDRGGALPTDQPDEERSEEDDNNIDPSLGNIDWSQGGYTIHLMSYFDHEMAKAFVMNYGRSLQDVEHPLDIYGAAAKDGVEFRVGLGLFDTVREAEAVMQQLAGRIPNESRVSRIQGSQ